MVLDCFFMIVLEKEKNVSMYSNYLSLLTVFNLALMDFYKILATKKKEKFLEITCRTLLANKNYCFRHGLMLLSSAQLKNFWVGEISPIVKIFKI